MKDPNRGTTDTVLRRLKEGSEERFRIQLFEVIRMLLDDFQMTWDDLADKLSARRSGSQLKAYVGRYPLNIEEINEIAHVFSAEPYIIFRPRKPLYPNIKPELIMRTDSLWCDKCGRIKLRSIHSCPPQWETNVQDYEGDEWITFYATTAKEAAELRARELDVGDYCLLNGGTAVVRVKTQKGIEEYIVTGETIPEYTALLIKPILRR